MNRYRLLLTLGASLLCITALTSLERPRAHADAEPLLIAVGTAFPAQDISIATLKAAFRGSIAHVAGKPIVAINHPLGTEMRVEFDRVVLGLEPTAVGRYWVDRRIRDQGSPPKSVPTAELALRVVAGIQTAVTYTRRSLVNPKIKVLTVDGKAAGQPGYALSPH